MNKNSRESRESKLSSQYLTERESVLLNEESSYFFLPHVGQMKSSGGFFNAHLLLLMEKCGTLMRSFERAFRCLDDTQEFNKNYPIKMTAILIVVQN